MPTMAIPALSLNPPWDLLVAIGAKKIETRNWNTYYRGPLAIHATKGIGLLGDEYGLYDQCMIEPFRGALRAAGYTKVREWPRGAIVAVCTLADTFQFTKANTANLSEQELAFGDFTPGRYGFRLANVHMLPEPIPARGKQGLWHWEGELPTDVIAAITPPRPHQTELKARDA